MTKKGQNVFTYILCPWKQIQSEQWVKEGIDSKKIIDNTQKLYHRSFSIIYIWEIKSL